MLFVVQLKTEEAEDLEEDEEPVQNPLRQSCPEGQSRLLVQVRAEEEDLAEEDKRELTLDRRSGQFEQFARLQPTPCAQKFPPTQQKPIDEKLFEREEKSIKTEDEDLLVDAEEGLMKTEEEDLLEESDGVLEAELLREERETEELRELERLV